MMRLGSGKPAAIAALLLVLPGVAWARSVSSIVVASTPFTPPAGFQWVPLLYLGLFVVVNALLLRRMVAIPLPKATAIVAGLGLALCLALLFCASLGAATWGSRPFLGWTWERAAPHFAWMNGLTLVPVLAGALLLAYYQPETGEFDATRAQGWAIGLSAALFVTLFLWLASRASVDFEGLFPAFLPLLAILPGAVRRLGRRVVPLIGANLAIYLVCLLPYVATGAYAHGAAPWDGCGDRFFSALGPTLLAYTRDHQGRLPDARTWDELLAQLGAYRDIEDGTIAPWWDGRAYGRRDTGKPGYCPAGEWYDRKPRPYRWNATLAGKSVAGLRRLRQPVRLISCPYHPYRYLDSRDLLKAYDDPKSFFVMMNRY